MIGIASQCLLERADGLRRPAKLIERNSETAAGIDIARVERYGLSETRNRFFMTAKRRQRVAETILRGQGFRLEGDRTLVMRKRFFMATKRRQRVAEIELRGRGFGLEDDRALETDGGLFGPVQPEQHGAEIVKSRKEIRSQRQSLLEMADGRIEILTARLGRCDAKRGMDLGGWRTAVNRLGKPSDRFVRTALLKAKLSQFV